MPDPLRPLSSRELLYRTFSLYRHHFKLFVGVSIIGPVAAFLYRLFDVGRMLASGQSESGAVTASMVVGIVVASTMMLAGLAISSGATAKAVAAVCLGREMRISEAYHAYRGRFWRIVEIALTVFIRALLVGACSIGLGVIALGFAAAVGYNSRAEAGAIGFACGGVAVISAIFGSIGTCARYGVAVQACVVEDICRKLALERSVFLSKGRRGRVAVVGGIFVITSFAMSFALEAFTLFWRAGIAVQVLEAVTILIAGALVAPLGTIGMSLVYYDERLRKEGFDRHAMMDALELPVVDARQREYC